MLLSVDLKQKESDESQLINGDRIGDFWQNKSD